MSSSVGYGYEGGGGLLLLLLLLALSLPQPSSPPLPPLPLSLPPPAPSEQQSYQPCSAFSAQVKVVTPDLVRSNQLRVLADAGHYRQPLLPLTTVHRIGGVRHRHVNTSQPLGPAPLRQRVNFTLELTILNEGLFTSRLNDIYSRGHPSYLKYYHRGEFARLHEHTPAEKAAIIDRLQTHGITTHYAFGRLLKVSATVDTINTFFHTEMTRYHHHHGVSCRQEKDLEFIAASYDVQIKSDFDIIAVHRLHTYPRRWTPLAKPKPVTSGNPNITARVEYAGNGNIDNYSPMRMMYDIPYDLDGRGQSIAIVGQPICLNDIVLFETNLMTGPPANVSLYYVSVEGSGITPSCSSSDDETTNDVSMVINMAPFLDNVTVYSSYDENFEALTQVATDDTAGVASSSWSGDDDAGALNSVLQQMAGQGQTFFSASGDSGCSSDFTPTDQPFCTSVGGTNMGSNWEYGVTDTSRPGEVSWFDSGGGVPGSFAIPTWQAAAAALNPQMSQIYRNVPDVGAYAGTRYYPAFIIYLLGTQREYAGTSLATPAWAGFLAVANQYQVRNGLPRIGFLNTLIYEIYSTSYYDFAFNDINDGGGNNYGSCNEGYTAGDGYDLVTGLGSMIGGNLIQALAELTSGCPALQAPALASAMMPLQANFEDVQTGTFGLNFPASAGQAFTSTGSRGASLSNPAQPYLSPKASIRLGQSYTEVFWLYLGADNANYPTYIMSSRVLGNSNSFWVSMPAGSTTTVQFGHGPDVSASQATYIAPSSLVNTWYHFAMVYNFATATASIFFDGTLVTSASTFIDSTNWQGSAGAGGQMQIGGGTNGVSFPIVGALQCVGWMNYALSSSQVSAIYNAQLSGGCSLGPID